MTAADRLAEARALARVLFGTDDEELMTVQQLLDWKALQAIIQAAEQRTWEALANKLEQRAGEISVNRLQLIEYCRQQGRT